MNGLAEVLQSLTWIQRLDVAVAVVFIFILGVISGAAYGVHRATVLLQTPSNSR